MMSDANPTQLDRDVKHRDHLAFLGLLAICILLFIDVQLPVVGSSNRLVALLAVPLLFLGRSRISTPFCAIGALLLSAYYLLPPLFSPTLDSHNFETILLYSLASLSAMVLLARAIDDEQRRYQLADLLIVFAITSAVLAMLQRYGMLDALGRNRWGHAITSDQSLRGAALLADPNFLATILASVVPLAVNWRIKRLRWPAVAVIALGVNATDSRAGIVLTILAIVLATFLRPSTADTTKFRIPKYVVVSFAVLAVLLALNIGGQRDRVITGIMIGAGLSDLEQGTVDAAAELSALNRREAAQRWMELGFESLPFGAGVNAQDRVDIRSQSGIAAHNGFVSAFGQGGVAGLLIDIVTIVAFIYLVRRRSEPFAVMGMIVVIGGLFLSYPGTPFFVLPLGLADGVRSARLGSTRDIRTLPSITQKELSSQTRV